MRTYAQKLIALAAAVLFAHAGVAQSNRDNSAENPYAGSVQAEPATPGVRQLSISDAIDLGIRHNLALRLAQLNQD